MTKTVLIAPDGVGPTEAAREKAQALIGQLVADRYQVEAVLAANETSAVYRAQHVGLRKRMALKVLHAGAPEADIARLDREAVAGAHIRHQGVVAATDSGELPDGGRYLAIEHVPGTTLREVLRKGPMPAPRALRVARQLAAALGAIHEKGIVHRNLEPRNVMLTGESGDEAKLIDFGRAKVDAARLNADASASGAGDDLTNQAPLLTATGFVEATSAYLPPETALGSAMLDARADLYSLGVVLYEMLAGKRPYDAEAPGALFAEQREKEVPPIAERAPGVTVSRQVEGVLQHLLNRDRTKRYPNAAAALVALESAARSMPEASPEADDGEAAPGPTGLPTLLGRQAAAGGTAARRYFEVASDALADGWDALLRKLGKTPEPRGPKVAERGTPVIDQPRPSPVVPAAIGGGLLLLVIVLIASRGGDDEKGASPDGSGRTSALAASGSAEAPVEVPIEVGGLDAPAWKSQLHAAVESQQWAKAARAVEALVELEPAAFNESSVANHVMSAAVALESVGGKDADAVFNALGARLGTRGLEILFDIVRTKGGTKGAKRAASILNEPDVVPLEPPALRIAFELTEAPCEQKPALFARAAEEGDERALTTLRMLREMECSRRNKGPCCFKDNTELPKAIARLRERLGVADPNKKPKD